MRQPGWGIGQQRGVLYNGGEDDWCVHLNRAGLGWSEVGPLPRNAEQHAKELHTLLQNAKVPGPYVMVGHSFGGSTSGCLSTIIFFRGSRGCAGGFDESEPNHPSRRHPWHLNRNPSRFCSIQATLARFGVARLIVKLLPGVFPLCRPVRKPTIRSMFAHKIFKRLIMNIKDADLGDAAAAVD